MNIIYICSTLERTGPTNQLFNIVTNLYSEYSATVITLSAEKPNSLKDKFDDQHIKIICLNLPPSLLINKQVSQLEHLLKTLNANVVHSQGIRADLLSSLAKYPVVKVATLRNVPFLDYPMTYGNILGGIMAKVHLWILNRIQQPVTVSHAVQVQVAPKLNNSLAVVHNGVDTNYFKLELVNKEQVQKLKERYELSSDDTVLLYCGILDQRKNIGLVLNALPTNKHIKLLILGEGALKETLKEHSAIKNGQAILCGAVNDVRPFLALSDVSISMSSAEGLPNSLLESMIMGVPIIASDIEPHKELIIENDVPIKLMTISEVGLSNFLSTDFYEWLVNAKKYNLASYAAKHFSASAMSEKYQLMYEELSRDNI